MAGQPLAILLHLVGCLVAVAYSGPQALELARTYLPNAVVSELVLPGLDGYSLAEQLGAESDAVLIALTGQGRERDRRRARKAGFQHFFVKPADPDEVLEVLAALSGPAVGLPDDSRQDSGVDPVPELLSEPC